MTTDPLVSTQWLAAHLNDPRVKILDATFKMPGVLPLPKDDYLAQHIPGAVFFDVDAVSVMPRRCRTCIRPPISSAATSVRSAFPTTTWW